MTTRLEHALEVSERAATLYLSGAVCAADAFPLRRICREIPVSVRTLRLDLNGVPVFDQGAMDAVRAVVRYWKHSRGGSFRLAIASEHLIAAVSAPEPGAEAGSAQAGSATRSAAMMGVYL